MWWRRRAVKIGAPALALSALIVLALFWDRMQGSSTPNVVVSGIVTDAATGEPVTNVRVADNRYHSAPNRAPQEAWTDAKGHYALLTWYEEHSIAASAPGYETGLQTLLTKVFSHAREVRVDFQLRRMEAPSASLTPKVEAVPEPADQEELPLGSFVAQGPESAIELLMVTHDTETNRVCWQPDGSVYTGPTFDVPARTLWMEDGLPFAFILHCPRWPEDTAVQFEFVPSYMGLASGGSLKRNEHPIDGYRLVQIRVRDDVTTGTLKVGLSTGPWQVLKRGPADSGSGHGYGGHSWQVAFLEATEAKGQVELTAGHNTVPGWETRIRAEDLQGRWHIGRGGSRTVNNQAYIKVSFDQVRLSDIKLFTFELRPLRWVEFRNVSLRPGVATSVEIISATGTNTTDHADSPIGQP